MVALFSVVVSCLLRLLLFASCWFVGLFVCSSLCLFVGLLVIVVRVVYCCQLLAVFVCRCCCDCYCLLLLVVGCRCVLLLTLLWLSLFVVGGGDLVCSC